MTKKYAKKCNACKYDDETLPEHCRNFKIKDCAENKNLKYCFECELYPCKRIENSDKSYKPRYKTSLIENGLYIKKMVLKNFWKEKKKDGLV
ncbi:MAG: DUF3795 domain-containing protein [Bacilli bacterium]